MRTCCVCKSDKSESEFSKRSGRAGGLRYDCKSCQSEYRKKWYRENAEAERAKVATYQAAHPEKVIEWEQRRKADPVRAAERKVRSAARWLTAPESVKEANRVRASAWVKANRERAQAHVRNSMMRHRAGKRLVLPADDWLMCLQVFDRRCAYCMSHESVCGRLHQEHVVPVSRGGEHSSDNVVPACRSCNFRKHTKSLWRLVLEGTMNAAS